MTRIQEVGRGTEGSVGGRGHPARGLGPACDWPVPHSETPLTLAAQTEGSVEVIRTLCLGGAHIDFRARDGMTALHKAACARHCLALTVRCQLPQTTTAMLTANCHARRTDSIRRIAPDLPSPPHPHRTVTPAAESETLLCPRGMPARPDSPTVPDSVTDPLCPGR